MVLVMLACVHATVCEPQLRYCQDDVYAKKQGENMHLGRNMERKNMEQVNKILIKGLTFVPYQTRGCNAAPDVTAAVLLSKVCIIFVKQKLSQNCFPCG